MSEIGRIAVVICTHNRSLSLLNTLTSLYTSNYSGFDLINIIVVANNCSDNTLEQLEYFKTIHFQKNISLRWLEEPNPGKSHALNTAIKNTKNDVLCFIDDDQIVEKGFLQHLIDGITQYPDNDIFCGQIRPAWDGTEPSWVHEKGRYAIPIRPFPEFNLGCESLPIGLHDGLPSGGNIIVRRRVFESIGHFAIDLGPKGHNLAGGEDHEFLQRARAKGHPIRYLPKVKQLHAIDPERLTTRYTLRKSYLRSLSNFLIHQPTNKPKLYMVRKIYSHLFNALFTFNKNRRFFYLVRFAASFGELFASLKIFFTKKSARI